MGIVMSIMGLIGVIWIPESPKWLVGQDRIAEAREAYSRIAVGNGRQDQLGKI